jgi:hypothetical protein
LRSIRANAAQCRAYVRLHIPRGLGGSRALETGQRCR